MFNFFILISSGKGRHIFENQKRDGRKETAVRKLTRVRVQCILKYSVYSSGEILKNKYLLIF